MPPLKIKYSMKIKIKNLELHFGFQNAPYNSLEDGKILEEVMGESVNVTSVSEE